MSDLRREAAGKITQQLFNLDVAGIDDSDPFYSPALEHLFGEIWAREGLALRDRSIATVSALIVLGREKELAFHLRGALNIGITEKEIEELVVHLGYYGGFPTAASARGVVADVLESIQAAT